MLNLFYFFKILISLSNYIGSCLRLRTDEYDQIIKFHFTESIFDIFLLSSIKSIILIISIAELELAVVRIASLSNTFQQVSDQSLETSTNSDGEALILNVDTKTQSSRAAQKRALYFLIILICFASMAYSAVKFSFVLKLIIESQSAKSNIPMDYFSFSILCTEFAFSLLQLFTSFFSWKSMRNLVKDIQTQTLNNEPEIEPKKNVNLARLLSLSKPELGLLATAGIALIISSTTNIIIPFFFGEVVDAATKFPDLKEMNVYVAYMFLVFMIGSIASGFRSWLFELAGQRVVARLRQQGNWHI